MRTYTDLVEGGVLSADAAQARAAASLQRLYDDLSRNGRGRRSLFRKARPPESLYLYGGVGRGKSLLMDLFFEEAPVEKKRRVHFHDFMLETHRQIFRWRNLAAEERRARPEYVKGVEEDPLPPAAKAVALKADLICFDEVQVTDIADAMILGRLFENLLEFGVTFVATSNRPPSDLYKDGINRQLFLPFIDLLVSR
ncbi:MAG: cell division protein ZapE, partial [Pseudomonadota bacterium]